MSAYIVKPESIATLLTFLASDPEMGSLVIKESSGTCTYSMRDTNDVTTIGNILYAENFRSFNYLYYKFDHDDAPKNRDFGWSFFPALGSFASPEQTTAYLAQIFKTCDHYEYQSCECPDYFTTPAAQVIDVIRRAAIRRLPGYNLAKWG